MVNNFLSEIHNFRDLAGMPTLCERKIKPGVVFRTANISHLSPEAAQWFKETYKISTYVDFRNDKEIAAFGKPDALIRTGVDWLNLQIHTDDRIFEHVIRPTVKDWAGLYSRLFEKNISTWVQFLKQILADKDATLYGCVFGKDRTGIATSFLLTTLDVHDEHIHKDYARTTDAMVPQFYSRFVSFWDRSGLTDAEVHHHFLTAHPEVMTEFVDYIRREDEKIYSILTSAGFTDEMQVALEKKLLS